MLLVLAFYIMTKNIKYVPQSGMLCTTSLLWELDPYSHYIQRKPPQDPINLHCKILLPIDRSFLVDAAVKFYSWCYKCDLK